MSKMTGTNMADPALWVKLADQARYTRSGPARGEQRAKGALVVLELGLPLQRRSGVIDAEQLELHCRRRVERPPVLVCELQRIRQSADVPWSRHLERREDHLAPDVCLVMARLSAGF